MKLGFSFEGTTMPSSQLINKPEACIVACIDILCTRIAQANDKTNLG